MSKAALIEAVVAVQAAMTPVPKTKEATVTKKDGTLRLQVHLRRSRRRLWRCSGP